MWNIRPGGQNQPSKASNPANGKAWGKSNHQFINFGLIFFIGFPIFSQVLQLFLLINTLAMAIYNTFIITLSMSAILHLYFLQFKSKQSSWQVFFICYNISSSCRKTETYWWNCSSLSYVMLSNLQKLYLNLFTLSWRLGWKWAWISIVAPTEPWQAGFISLVFASPAGHALVALVPREGDPWADS